MLAYCMTEQVALRHTVWKQGEKSGTNTDACPRKQCATTNSFISRGELARSQVTNSRFQFDDRNITWYPLGEFEHLALSLLDLDVDGQVVDFIVKFDAN